MPDPAERRAFTACLTGAADDTSGPLRVVVAMRSDFLDRAAEDRSFVEELARGLVFLQPPNRRGLEEALTQPLESVGYGFEPGVVASMLDTLEATPGPLPLLQFTAAKLWDTRDLSRRVLTRSSYDAMGGVSGALATHADEVVTGFTADDQKLVRLVFQRLVTPERTRAIVDSAELRELGGDVDRIVGLLVAARLVVVHSTAVELVHESLIKDWPQLRRWLDENQEDAAFLAQVRAAAQQWDQKNRVEGLLWRNEAMDEARLWRARSSRVLPPRETAFLDAVFALANRASRTKRRIVYAVFTFLCILVAAAAIALIMIRNAEHAATVQAQKATEALAQGKEAQAEKDVETARASKALEDKAAALQKHAEDLEKLNKAEQEKTALKDETVKAQGKANNATAVAAREKAQREATQAKLEAAQKQKEAEQKKRSGSISTGGLK